MGQGNDNSSSLTADENFHTTTVAIFFIVSFLVALGNLLVIVSVQGFTQKYYSINPLISSLSLTDILQLLGPAAISFSVYFSEGTRGFQQLYTLCRIQAWLIIFQRTSASLSVLFLGLDRTLSLIKQIFYQRRWKGGVLVGLVFAVWIFSAFLASCLLFGLGSVSTSRDAPHVYCLFKPDGDFAITFVSFHIVVVSLSVFFMWNMLSSSRQTLFSAKYSSSTGKVSVEKRRNLIQEQHSRKISGMAAVVIGLYCACLLPWIVSVFLGWFSVDYPHLYGLVSQQIPMVSGLINPLLYGIMWPPYRRAYIRALSAPLVACRNIRGSQQRSHDLTAQTLSRSHSFWSTDVLPGKAADQENSFDILFGPSSYNQPLDFKPDELLMFDNQGSSNSIELDLNSNHYQKQPVSSSDHIVIENSAQFQSILDLIEEMTDGRTKSSGITEENSLRRERSKSIDSKTSSAYWSADKSSIHASSEVADMEEVKLSFDHEADGSAVEQCKQERSGSVKSGMAGCSCLGKSKCYVVKDNSRYLDYLVQKEVTEIAESSEGVIFIDV